MASRSIDATKPLQREAGAEHTLGSSVETGTMYIARIAMCAGECQLAACECGLRNGQGYRQGDSLGHSLESETSRVDGATRGQFDGIRRTHA
ncbi:MAG: hypothetical protein E5299_02412 [Burkholderia gladioli]|nr:MAG: hypothetical protein E5299_02412 [Burkholderia gladioli]